MLTTVNSKNSLNYSELLEFSEVTATVTHSELMAGNVARYPDVS